VLIVYVPRTPLILIVIVALVLNRDEAVPLAAKTIEPDPDTVTVFVDAKVPLSEDVPVSNNPPTDDIDKPT
jgi:hypothetical protein